MFMNSIRSDSPGDQENILKILSSTGITELQNIAWVGLTESQETYRTLIHRKFKNIYSFR
jgi:hypothetical protein